MANDITISGKALFKDKAALKQVKAKLWETLAARCEQVIGIFLAYIFRQSGIR